MNKTWLLLGVGLLALLGVAFWQGQRRDSLPREVEIGSQTFTLEWAVTDEERRQGLGSRDDLCARCAMLFVFDTPGRHAFWMQGMRFPLDIAWLLGDAVVWIERRIPSDSPATYRPDTPADRVLEFNAGTLDGVEQGDRVRFLSPPK